jgi:hypothetical protein
LVATVISGSFRSLSACIGAPGPHDFTVRISAVRLRAGDRSQAEACPAIPLHARRCRVHRIPPRVRDDREPPLDGTRQQQDKSDLGQSRNDLFLRGGLDKFSRAKIFCLSGKSLSMKIDGAG